MREFFIRKPTHKVIVLIENYPEWFSIYRDFKLLIFLFNLERSFYFTFFSNNFVREGKLVWFRFLKNLKRYRWNSLEDSNSCVFHIKRWYVISFNPLSKKPIEIFS